MCISASAFAQFRSDMHRSSDYLGTVVKDRDREPGDWSNLFNMTMDHSYSMAFGSLGGQFQNMNAYTNTMHFFFSERLTGRVDLSLLHSPFGNTFMNNGQSGTGVDFVIRNAELKYEINDRSTIQIQFQQVPSPYNYGVYGMSPFGNRYYGGSNF